MPRAFFAWLFAPLKLCFALGVFVLVGLAGALASLFRRDEETLDEIKDPPAIAQQEERDEDDDALRRWLFDMSPEQRIGALGRGYSKQAFAPLYPFIPRWRRGR